MITHAELTNRAARRRRKGRPPFDELWAALEAALPSPAWTITLQRMSDQRWWVFVEPDAATVPDPAQRREMRLNYEGTERDRALHELTLYLRRLYPRLELVR